MAANQSEPVLLARSTLKLYRASLAGAWRGLRLNWWACYFPYLYVAALMLCGLVAQVVLGRLLGGFLISLVLAFLLGHYFSLISSAVRAERGSFRLALESAKELFFPLIGVLFSLFILNLVADAALKRPDLLWVRRSLNLVLFIFFNSLPEVIYLRRNRLSLESFAESFEFIKENFVEWFLPMFILFSPFILASPMGFVTALGRVDPLQLAFIFAVGSIGESLVFALVLLPVVFFVMIFRGALFLRLAGSSRRKRIYQERFGG